MLKIAIHGAAGRMGTTILQQLVQNPKMKLVGAVDVAAAPNCGKDAGEVAGIDNVGVPIQPDLHDATVDADVIIDFSLAGSLPQLLETALKTKKPLVIGTTGHTDDQMAMIQSAAKTIPIFKAPNMSIGVNLLWRLSKIAAKTLGDDYPIAILERHHIHKKDAPSGTAKEIVRLVAEERNLDPETDVTCSDGPTPFLSDKPITVQAIREGEIVGDHIVSFNGPNERIELSHFAENRTIFAEGALTAAEWISDKPAGLYDMQDVLFKNS